MTPKQNNLYWREWSAAHKADPKADRHQLHVEALGHDKSHLDFTNDDFDKVLGAFRAISRPGDLNAQLRQIRGQHRRALYILERLMRQLGVDRNYVQAVIDQMQIEHPTAFTRHPTLDDLTAPELEKVIIALRKQAKRQCEPAEAPF